MKTGGVIGGCDWLGVEKRWQFIIGGGEPSREVEFVLVDQRFGAEIVKELLGERGVMGGINGIDDEGQLSGGDGAPENAQAQ